MPRRKLKLNKIRFIFDKLWNTDLDTGENRKNQKGN